MTSSWGLNPSDLSWDLGFTEDCLVPIGFTEGLALGLPLEEVGGTPFEVLGTDLLDDAVGWNGALGLVEVVVPLLDSSTG